MTEFLLGLAFLAITGGWTLREAALGLRDLLNDWRGA